MVGEFFEGAIIAPGGRQYLTRLGVLFYRIQPIPYTIYDAIFLREIVHKTGNQSMKVGVCPLTNLPNISFTDFCFLSHDRGLSGFEDLSGKE